MDGGKTRYDDFQISDLPTKLKKKVIIDFIFICFIWKLVAYKMFNKLNKIDQTDFRSEIFYFSGFLFIEAPFLKNLVRLTKFQNNFFKLSKI